MVCLFLSENRKYYTRLLVCSIVVATWESGGDGISIVGIGTSSEGMGWGWGRCLWELVGMGTKSHTRAKLYVKY